MPHAAGTERACTRSSPVCRASKRRPGKAPPGCCLALCFRRLNPLPSRIPYLASCIEFTKTAHPRASLPQGEALTNVRRSRAVLCGVRLQHPHLCFSDPRFLPVLRCGGKIRANIRMIGTFLLIAALEGRAPGHPSFFCFFIGLFRSPALRSHLADR